MTTNTTTIDNTQDIIDIRDIIERIETLEDECDGLGEEDCTELQALRSILEELKGQGGDEQWRGDWYPITLIRESYFTDYVKELLEDCGDIPRDLPSYIEIDWQATAKNVQVDYSEIEINGVTYYYR